MEKINNQTEKEFRDRQSEFGHLHRGQNLQTWLDTTYKLDETRKNRYRRVAEKFLGTKENLKILEIAAGVGDFVVFCSKLFPGHKYFANDLSEVQLKGNIQEVANYFHINELPELSFGPVENLAYTSDSFDVVFIKAAVHHFEDPQKGLTEIHRILKPGGKLIFFEEPVCLNLPIYSTYRKNNFALEERAQGLNEHIYTVSDYYAFGKAFAKKNMYLDEELVEEFDRQQSKRKEVKAFLGNVLRQSPLFKFYMIWRFSSAVFVFSK